jgi:hypothetical protein
VHSFEKAVANGRSHFVEAAITLESNPIGLGLLSRFDSLEDLFEVARAFGYAHGVLVDMGWFFWLSGGLDWSVDEVCSSNFRGAVEACLLGLI